MSESSGIGSDFPPFVVLFMRTRGITPEPSMLGGLAYKKKHQLLALELNALRVDLAYTVDLCLRLKLVCHDLTL